MGIYNICIVNVYVSHRKYNKIINVWIQIWTHACLCYLHSHDPFQTIHLSCVVSINWNNFDCCTVIDKAPHRNFNYWVIFQIENYKANSLSFCSTILVIILISYHYLFNISRFFNRFKQLAVVHLTTIKKKKSNAIVLCSGNQWLTKTINLV